MIKVIDNTLFARGGSDTDRPVITIPSQDHPEDKEGSVRVLEGLQMMVSVLIFKKRHVIAAYDNRWYLITTDMKIIEENTRREYVRPRTEAITPLTHR